MNPKEVYRNLCLGFMKGIKNPTGCPKAIVLRSMGMIDGCPGLKGVLNCDEDCNGYNSFKSITDNLSVPIKKEWGK